MSNSYNEDDRRRDPVGRWANKPGVHGTPDMGLASDPLSIDDPKLQELQCPWPHLDGATVEYSDGTRATLKVIIDPRGVERVDTDRVVPDTTRRFKTYKVTSFCGDPQRLDNELEYLAAQNEASAAKRLMYEAQDPLERMTGSTEMYREDTPFGESLVIQVGDNYAEFTCWTEDGEVKSEFDEGYGPTPKTKTNKVEKAIKSKKFGAAMSAFLEAERRSSAAEKALDAKYQELDKLYGPRPLY